MQSRHSVFLFTKVNIPDISGSKLNSIIGDTSITVAIPDHDSLLRW
jgi:hypothetical protein